LPGAWSQEVETNLLLPRLQSNVIDHWSFFRPLLLLSIEEPLLAEHQLASHEPSVECPDLLQVVGDIDKGEDECADKGEAEDDQDYLNLLSIHLRAKSFFSRILPGGKRREARQKFGLNNCRLSSSIRGDNCSLFCLVGMKQCSCYTGRRCEFLVVCVSRLNLERTPEDLVSWRAGIGTRDWNSEDEE